VRISIILPLFDRRNAGWRSLVSAVGQDFPRDQYEVIAVAGRGIDGGMDDPAIAALLARCDTVVRTGLDTQDVANEIHLFRAGYERSTGNVLFFMEGHTVLGKGCCAMIAAHFRLHPEAEIAWAPRLNHDESPLGRLISMHNLRHERRAYANGVFSLGATNVITRGLFERLGGFDARYLRFSETALFHRSLDEGIAIGRIHEPLATHYNDVSVALWRQLVMTAGAAKFSYYNALISQGKDIRARVRHKVYLLASSLWTARLLFPLFRLAGRVFLVLATRMSGLSEVLAYRLYVFAIGFTDLSGFCQARIRAARTDDPKGCFGVPPSARGANSIR
jgi:hypothetical protein